MINNDSLEAFLSEAATAWAEEPEFTFRRNLGTVTVRDRIVEKTPDDSWTITYRNTRIARIADDGTLVHYITDHCYFAYKDAYAFLEKRDNSRNNLAFNEPIPFSGLL